MTLQLLIGVFCSELVMLTIQKAGRVMSLLVESLHMRIYCETVYWSTGVGFIRRALLYIPL